MVTEVVLVRAASKVLLISYDTCLRAHKMTPKHKKYKNIKIQMFELMTE